MYIQYFGNGAYMILFLISLIYILIKEKQNKTIRIFLYGTIILAVIIFNPLVYKILEPIFSGGVYWRMFWMFPIAITVPYVAVKWITEKKEPEEVKTKGKIFWQKAFIGVAICVIIILSGKVVFNTDNFEVATNWYKLPQEALEIATMISEDSCEKKVALVPETIVAYIRQYNSDIILRYARNPHTYANEPMVSALQRGAVAEIMEDSEKHGTNYIVFRNETSLTENMEDYGFEILGKTNTYTVYKRKELC